jgi:glutamine amidotransferase
MRAVCLATGVGNVRSVVRALVASAPAGSIRTTADPEIVRTADVLVVPGQGSFDAFADALDRDGGALRQVVLEHVRRGAPYLGICLGMQILFASSEESARDAHGLGVLRGRVRRVAPGAGFALPHMGWNRAEGEGLVAPAHYYFAHTYAAAPEDARDVLASTTYGIDAFASAVARENVVGVQFHPEKSQRAGLTLLAQYFAKLEG